jgi:hypothetical protein
MASACTGCSVFAGIRIIESGLRGIVIFVMRGIVANVRAGRVAIFCNS